MAKCVLDGVTELITENDHRAGLCLCSECTCQRHVCPYTHHPKSSPKFAYKSSYKESFRRHKVRPRSAQASREYKPNLFKLDSQTTAKNDFLPYEVQTRPKKSSPGYRCSPNRLPYKSRYQDEYKSWNDFLESPQKPPPKSVPVTGKFSGVSSYTVSFDSKKPSPSKAIVPEDNGNPVNWGYPGFMTSTQRSAFAPRKSEAPRPIKAKDNTMLLMGYSGQYKSEFQSSVSPRPATGPLRRARKNIFSN